MISKYIFPSYAPNKPWADWLAVLPAEAIPYVAGLLLARQLDYTWTLDSSPRGRELINATLIGLYMGAPLQELLELNRQLYRLIDNSLNGTEYTATPGPEGTVIIDPPIPVVPAPGGGLQALRPAADRAYRLLAFELSNVAVPGDPLLGDTSNTLKSKILELITEIDETEEQGAETLARIASIIAAL